MKRFRIYRSESDKGGGETPPETPASETPVNTGFTAEQLKVVMEREQRLKAEFEQKMESWKTEQKQSWEEDWNRKQSEIKKEELVNSINSDEGIRKTIDDFGIDISTYDYKQLQDLYNVAKGKKEENRRSNSTPPPAGGNFPSEGVQKITNKTDVLNFFEKYEKGGK